MQLNKLTQTLVGADLSALIRITLRCLTVSPHSLRSGQALSRSEGSVCMGHELLRCVYTERSECAQHDRAVTHTDAWTNLFICIIGLGGYSAIRIIE